MNKIAIKNGRIIDPANQLDELGNLFLSDGKIIPVCREPDGFQPDLVIDANKQIVCPGLIDLSVRLREPGQSWKATIASELRAAAAGGITTVCQHPDTQPVIDTAAVAELVKDLAKKAGYPQLLPIAALTRRLEGLELSNMLTLKQVGCVAVSNAEQPVKNLLVLRRAMEYAASHDLLIIIRPNDPWLSNSGCVHEGALATRYGLPSIPDAAETIALAQCLELAELVGCRIHFGQLSSRRAVIRLYQAKKYGLAVSADVSAYQLYLSEDDMVPFDSVYHVLPPLRAKQDQAALREAVTHGTVDCLCSNHQPHDLDAKLGAFPETEPGISSLETLLPLVLNLVTENICNLSQALATVTCKPAEILKLPVGSLREEGPADICIFDPEHKWQVNSNTWLSQGQNTPYWGKTLQGRAIYTIQGGKIIHNLAIKPLG